MKWKEMWYMYILAVNTHAVKLSSISVFSMNLQPHCIYYACNMIYVITSVRQAKSQVNNQNLKERGFSCMMLVLCSLLLHLLLSAPGSVIIARGQGQMTDVKVLERGDDWQCASMEERERARYEIHRIADSVIIASATGPIHTCNGTPGWRRVAFINMTDTSYNCPTGLNLTSYSKRTCGRSHVTRTGCSSTSFSVEGLPYSCVCGRIRGYQFGAPSAFYTNIQNIDSSYVEGVSLTHGDAGSRQHIWTFAAGLSEVTTSYPDEGCPCDTAAASRVPLLVRNDYFCESRLNSDWYGGFVLYPDDVL